MAKQDAVPNWLKSARFRVGKKIYSYPKAGYTLISILKITPLSAMTVLRQTIYVRTKRVTPYFPEIASLF